MYHVELRQSLNSARSFNLTEGELRSTVLDAWLAGRPVRLSDREFDPARARLRIVSGPELRLDELGMGRGWSRCDRAADRSGRRER
jgi:hypothetical protein